MLCISSNPFNIFYGFGVGIHSVIAPLYLKDIIPEAIFNSFLPLYITFFAIRMLLNSLVDFIFESIIERDNHIIAISFLMSCTSSLIQLLALLFLLTLDLDLVRDICNGNSYSAHMHNYDIHLNVI